MIAQDVAHLERNPEWRLVLEAYERQQAGSTDGWVDRITEIDGLATELLSRAHGKLIAHGLLEFDLADRGSGMRYQLSTLAVRTLRFAGGAHSGDDDEANAEQAGSD